MLSRSIFRYYGSCLRLSVYQRIAPQVLPAHFGQSVVEQFLRLTNSRSSAGVSQGVRRWIMRWQLAQGKTRVVEPGHRLTGCVQRHDMVTFNIAVAVIAMCGTEVEVTRPAADSVMLPQVRFDLLLTVGSVPFTCIVLPLQQSTVSRLTVEFC